VTARDALAVAALARATAVIDELTERQLEDLAEGRGHLVFRPSDTGSNGIATDLITGPGNRTGNGTGGTCTAGSARRRADPPPAGVDISSAVAAIRALTTPAEVSDYLHQHDRRFTTPVLKQIARALGPTVPTTARSKADLKRDIVAGTAGFRLRSAAMSGGAWS
jgi:hypothetical protein